MSVSPIRVLAFYKFAELPDAAELRTELARFCCSRGIRGSFIIAPEGLNGTVAGAPEAIDALVAYLNAGLFGTRLHGAEAKLSTAETMPFLRMKVRLKPEIVTLRAPEANPAKQVGTYVKPADWNALIGQDDVLLIDTRNSYETAIGSFEGALDPGTSSFTEFKDYVRQHLDPRQNKRVAMFCTGGIRCEKASSYLLAHGFEQVFHLEGGILRYLEDVPEAESRFNGECFVFDERVSVRHGLEQGSAKLCRGCRNPMLADTLTDGLCEGCRTSVRAAGALERDRQLRLAADRGEAHLGEDAIAAAERNRAAKAERRRRSARPIAEDES